MKLSSIYFEPRVDPAEFPYPLLGKFNGNGMRLEIGESYLDGVIIKSELPSWKSAFWIRDRVWRLVEIRNLIEEQLISENLLWTGSRKI